MPLLDDLSRQIAAYRSGRLSLGNFEDWFRTASRRMFAEADDVLQACVAVEEAFSRLQFEHIPESDFAEELENAIHPFVRRSLDAQYAEPYTVVPSPHRILVATAAVSVALWAVAPDHQNAQHLPLGTAAVSAPASVVGNPSKDTASATEPVPLQVAV